MLIFLVLYSFYRKDIPTAPSPLGGLTWQYKKKKKILEMLGFDDKYPDDHSILTFFGKKWQKISFKTSHRKTYIA